MRAASTSGHLRRSARGTRRLSQPQRVTAILTELARAEPDIGISDLSRAVGIAKSAIHRILSVLADEGFVTIDESHRYKLGPAAVHLGIAALARSSIRERGARYLREMRDRTGETTTLALLIGTQRSYVDLAEGIHAVRNVLKLGMLQPLHMGSNGKAILAFMPAKVRDEIVAAAGPIRCVDGRTITKAALVADLAMIRRRGYSISVQELVRDANSVSAPVFDDSGQVVGCLGISGVISRESARDLQRFGTIVRDAAERLSRDLGWQGTWRSLARTA